MHIHHPDAKCEKMNIAYSLFFSIKVIMGSLHVLDIEQQQSEVALWRRLAQEKSRELEGFRLELDSILDVLKHLQSAGWREAPPLSPPKQS